MLLSFLFLRTHSSLRVTEVSEASDYKILAKQVRTLSREERKSVHRRKYWRL